MVNKHPKNIPWNFFSISIIANFTILQIIRWRILPQFMDIYYHILTAWGFIQAGGYTGWDFWQYAPVGRVHIYPPFFHIILAFFLKLGVGEVILAKTFETIMPPVFLITLWHFTQRNYSERLAFFVMLTTAASFSFYMNLINHIPATLALILGILALGHLLEKKVLRATLLLSLCFYTHIGISWFFALCMVICSLANREYREHCLMIFMFTIVLSSPILFKQLYSIRFISRIGMNLNEKYLCQFKIIEYILAIFGLFLSFKLKERYWLFLGLFFASFIFLSYPYRFFSAEGYFPIIFLAAVALDNLYNRLRTGNPYLNYSIPLLIFFLLIMSPTILMEKVIDKIRYKAPFAHSAFMGMLLPADESRGFSNTIWFPEAYISAARSIQQNSNPQDIIYSSIDMLGVTFASISKRATSNALFPEIKAAQNFDPLSVAKIIIMAKDENPQWISFVIYNYRLIKLGENKLFVFYRNPYCQAKVNAKRATVPFTVIIFISLIYIILFWQGKDRTGKHTPPLIYRGFCR